MNDTTAPLNVYKALPKVELHRHLEGSLRLQTMLDVAEDHGIAAEEQDSATAGSPLADYSVSGLDNDRLSNASAGLVGLAVTAVAGFGLFYVLKGRQN